MNVPWDAIALMIRQTAPGLLICASVLIASLLVLQAWSKMVGVGVGAIAAVLASALEIRFLHHHFCYSF